MTVYLAFYKATQGRFIDKLISVIDGSRYSHVELVIKQNGYVCDCISSSNRDGGMRRKTINCTPNKWTLVPVQCDVEFALRWYDRRQNFGYDYWALLRTKIPFAYNPEYKLFCSEACAAMLELVDPASYGIKKLLDWAVENNH